MTSRQLTAIGSVSIESDNQAFRTALVRDALRIEQVAGPDCSFVLLGSIASDKYTEPLVEVFGERLVFPADFVGRGDMSRGGLMLRAAGSGIELSYLPVDRRRTARIASTQTPASADQTLTLLLPGDGQQFQGHRRVIFNLFHRALLGILSGRQRKNFVP